MKSLFTPETISAGVPEPLRRFLNIGTLAFPATHNKVIESFWQAAGIVNGKCHVRRLIHVLFARNPFMMKLNNGDFTFAAKPDVINLHFEGKMLIDCEKMIRLEQEHQVVCVLEEFVHALMNVSDEILASQIVDLLYDEITFREGRYQIVQT